MSSSSNHEDDSSSSQNLSFADFDDIPYVNLDFENFQEETEEDEELLSFDVADILLNNLSKGWLETLQMDTALHPHHHSINNLLSEYEDLINKMENSFLADSTNQEEHFPSAAYPPPALSTTLNFALIKQYALEMKINWK